MELLKSAKEVENLHVKNGLSKKFCIVPFTTLLLEPNGSVGACRHKGTQHPVGHILHQSLEEIWNGAFLKSWRQEFLDGNPSTCSQEVKDRRCNHCPSYNKLFETADLNVNQSKKPSRIAFNFNGHCNLECNMCHIWKMPNGLYDAISFWDNLTEWIEDLQEVELLSGEPFIQKDTYRLIDHISKEKPNVLWTMTTNANWILTPALKSKLDAIHFKNIIVSLDCVTPEYYQLIRKKGNFKKAIDTIRALKLYEKERMARGLSALNIRVNFLFQQINWKDLAQVDDFSKKEGVEIFRTFLYEPAELSLLTLAEDKRIEILEWYLEMLNPETLKNCMRILRPLLDSLSLIHRAHFYEELSRRI